MTAAATARWRCLLSLRDADDRVRVLDFSRNFGHQIAITAGSDFAGGDAVIVMDADLQDPPETILRMIDKWREGFEVVYAVRTERQGETKFKLWTASLFYRLLQRITDVNIPLDTGDFRLMDRRVVLAMRRLREKHRFIRGLSSWVGFKQMGVEYERSQRYAGATKYPLRKMLRLAMNAITSFSYVPLHLATYVGFALAGLSLLGIIVTIIMRLSGSSFFLGQATTLVSVLFLGGVQLIFLGIIGEYLGRIYDEAKDRPLYIVSHAYGFLDEEAPMHPRVTVARRMPATQRQARLSGRKANPPPAESKRLPPPTCESPPHRGTALAEFRDRFP